MPALQLTVCRIKFCLGVHAKTRPVENDTELTITELNIVLLLLMQFPHRSVQVLPLNQIDKNIAPGENMVQVRDKISKLFTFLFQFF